MVSRTPEEITAILIEVAGMATRQTIPSSPFGRRLSERIHNPRPGDLVLEVSQFRQPRDVDSIGIFKGRITDLDHTDAPRLWVVESLVTGKDVNWGNAEFRAVPNRQLYQECQELAKGGDDD